jgi:hypothetical protein
MAPSSLPIVDIYPLVSPPTPRIPVMPLRLAPPAASLTRTIAAVLTLGTFMVACSKASNDAKDTTGATVATAASDDASKGTIHLEVTGGPNAGSYDVDMPGSGCSYGLAGPTAWGNQYSIDTDDAKKFSSLQLIVPDAKAAAGGTSAFQMTVQFGPLFGGDGASYDVNTRADAPKKSGSGTVTVEDHGSTGRVTFDAKTDANVELKGTIDCTSVVRNG